jgi:hypothetical protein
MVVTIMDKDWAHSFITFIWSLKGMFVRSRYVSFWVTGSLYHFLWYERLGNKVFSSFTILKDGFFSSV